VGMRACLGAVVRAPITSILIVFEMTHDFALVPPLMLAALVSQALSRTLCKENFYNQFLKDSGIHLETTSSLRAQASWRNRRASTFADFDAPYLKSLEEKLVQEHLEKYPNNVFPLLDKNDQPTALLDRNELQNFLKAKQEPNLHSPVLVYPEQTMQEIEGFFEAAPLHTLVMVTKDNRYLGIFTQQEAKHSMEKEEFLATS
jgi:CIC family chloride channel protein